MKNYRKKASQIREKIKNDEFDEDKKGRSVIKINVSDETDVLSKYNDDGQEIIGGEMADFINNLVKSVPKDKEIVLDVKCADYSEEKAKRYKNAIVNYYINEFADKDAKLKNNLIISIILFAVGVLGFAALYLLNLFNAYWLIRDIVEVTSWVFLWETVDVFFLNRGVLKWKQKRDLKIIFAEIKIMSLKNKTK